jgi:hypothetical protein
LTDLRFVTECDEPLQVTREVFNTPDIIPLEIALDDKKKPSLLRIPFQPEITIRKKTYNMSAIIFCRTSNSHFAVQYKDRGQWFWFDDIEFPRPVLTESPIERGRYMSSLDTWVPSFVFFSSLNT